MDLAFEDGDNFIRNLVTVRMGSGSPLVSAPARKVERDGGLPIPVEEIIEDLRLDSDDEEATLTRLERGACDWLERTTGLVTIPGTYQVLLPEWWRTEMWIMRGPVRDLVSVDYLAGANNWASVDLANFHVDEEERRFGVLAVSTFDRPTLWSEARRVRLTFKAGFPLPSESGSGGDGPQMPDGLRTTLIMAIGHFYKYRELFDAGKVADVELSAGNILSAYRQFW